MLNQEELAQLMEARHPDAFSVLGLRQRGPHWWLHALLPGASAVTLLAQPGGQAIAPPKALHALGDSGVWAVDLGPDTPPTDYRLQVCWPGPAGEPPVEQLLDDPYRFGLLLGELDLWLLAEGRHLRPWECLGAHPITLDGVAGTRFAVWAPNARHVSVVGDFNHWEGRRHPMRLRREAGLWELFLPGVAAGALYKFEVLGADGSRLQKADPFALRAELRPATASVVQGLPAHRPMAPERARANQFDQPISIYEVHLGSWRKKEGWRWLSYRELADSPMPATWASPTCSCCASASTPSMAPAATSPSGCLPPPRALAAPKTSSTSSTRPMPPAWA